MEHPNFNDQLFVPAVDVIVIRLEYRIPEGWALWFKHRHSGEGWERCPSEDYSRLTSVEAMQVIDATLDGLGLAEDVWEGPWPGATL